MAPELRGCGGAPRTQGASRTRRRFPLHQRQLHLGDPLIQQGAEAQLKLFCTLGLTSKGLRWKESVLLRGVKLPSASLSQAVEMVLYGSLVEFSLTS
jgi:hypothetical protein